MAFHQRENEIHMVCTDALDNWGYVLTFDSTNCQLALATATDMPVGIAQTSTVNYITNVATANQEVNVKREGVCYVRLLATNTAFNCGDYVATAAGGYCDVAAINTAGTIAQYHNSVSYIVGIALEAKGANAGGTVRVLLTMRNM